MRHIDDAFFAEFVIGFAAAHKSADTIIVQLLADPAISLDLMARLLRHYRVTVAVFVLAWWSVCAVKLSFLVFFRQLLRRQSGRVMLCWWATLVFTLAATVYLFVVGQVNCPHYGDWAKLGKPPPTSTIRHALGPVMQQNLTQNDSDLVACAGHSQVQRQHILSYAGTVLDIISDILST